MAARLQRLLSTPGASLYEDPAAVVAGFEQRLGLPLSDGQRRAVARALESKVFVVTGGPGTGKTTLVNALIALLQAPGLEVARMGGVGRRRRCGQHGRPDPGHRIPDEDRGAEALARRQR